MQAGRLDDAEGQFRRALARAPNNGWSYYGLAELYRTRGDAEAARKADAELTKTWIVNCWTYPGCDAHPAFDLRPGNLETIGSYLRPLNFRLASD